MMCACCSRISGKTARILSVFCFLFVSQPKAQNCSHTSTGFVPLTDLGIEMYRGFVGGLYQAGSNEIPSDHLEAGLLLARQVEPVDGSGQRDVLNGKYVFLAIGLSNTTQEFSEFLPMMEEDGDRSPMLAGVDGAVGGWAASDVIDPLADYWNIVDGRLLDIGLTADQVQVVWLKTADRRPTLSFPEDARLLQGEMLLIVQIIKERFPNTKIVYLSSRTYAGYAKSKLNPEPFAYQSGFAVKWLIEEQITGNPELNYDSSAGEVKAPWLAWGPYLWTDGLGSDNMEAGVPGRGDGLEWTCDTEDSDGDGFLDGDVASDGIHPSISGRVKVANLLMEFVKTDSTAEIWYLNMTSSTGVDEETETGQHENFVLRQNYPNPFSTSTTIQFEVPEASTVVFSVYDLLGREVFSLVRRVVSRGEHLILFDAQALPGGLYIYRLQTRQGTISRSMLLSR